jgi:NhaP-type Na+/H+ or K+/H+ antiporter
MQFIFSALLGVAFGMLSAIIIRWCFDLAGRHDTEREVLIVALTGALALHAANVFSLR